MQILHRLLRRAAERAIPVMVIAALALVAVGLYLFVNDRPALDAERRLQRELAAVEGRLADVARRIEAVEVEVTPAKERTLRAEKVIAQLRELQGTWDWFVGNRAQQRANQERLQKMEALHADAAAKLAELQQQVRRLKWERDGDEIERDRLRGLLRAEEAKKASWSYYFRRAWLRARGWLLIAVAAYLLGPVLVPVVWKRWREKRATVV